MNINYIPLREWSREAAMVDILFIPPVNRMNN